MKGFFRNILIPCLICLMAFGSARAETVSQKQAQQMAQQFFNEAAGRVVAPVKLIYNGRKLTTDRLFVPFYVYNQPSGGFVIISAENKTYPILGYSLKDNFDPERLGETEKALLQSYAREIELIRYDTSIPEDAIKAWTDYPGYVYGILNSAYSDVDPLFSADDARERLYMSVEPESDDASFSDIYTPTQWQDMVNDELRQNASVAVGVIADNVINPMVVHGRKGDYYRLEMSKRNNWLMRLNASELISANMIGLFNNPLFIAEELQEEVPFETYDDFAIEVASIEEARTHTPAPDLSLFVDEPIVKALGSGHYEILMPEEAAMATVYNLGGAQVMQKTFRNTNAVYLDLSAEPSGFYFVQVIDRNGTPYGMKLYR